MLVPAPRDARVREVCLHFLPVETRVPLKFGPETLTHVICARVRVLLEAPTTAATGTGWGETPLSVQWVWPAVISFEDRHQALKVFCEQLARAWARFDHCGHPLEIGHAFQRQCLPGLLEQFNGERSHPMPWLAALVCCSAFDLAVHDAYGILYQCPVYETYHSGYMNQDLSAYLQPADGSLDVSFDGRYPADFFELPRAPTLPAWHLVGGLDPLSEEDLTGEESSDGHPVLLADWIDRDGLTCLKIKLRGDDSAWDYQRLQRVGAIMGVETNSMQFYPEASAAEAAVYPGVYRRRDGRVDLASVQGPGFGYGLSKIQRQLPAAVVSEVS